MSDLKQWELPSEAILEREYRYGFGSESNRYIYSISDRSLSNKVMLSRMEFDVLRPICKGVWNRE